MDIKDILQAQRRGDSERIARLRRVQEVDKSKKIRKIKDSEKDNEESKNKRREVVADVVITQTDKDSCGTTIELTERASKIADRYEAQKYMEGQHSGNIEKLRSALNNVSDKEAIEEVKQNGRNKQKAAEAYEKSVKYKGTKQNTFEEER